MSHDHEDSLRACCPANEWLPPDDPDGITLVPHGVGRAPVSDAAFRAWVALRRWTDRGAVPTNAMLAIACGWLGDDGKPATQKAKRALRELEQAGLVRRVTARDDRGVHVRVDIACGEDDRPPQEPPRVAGTTAIADRDFLDFRFTPMKPSAKNLMLILDALAGDHAWCIPSLKHLGRELSRSYRLVQTLMQSLESSGWIRRVYGSQNQLVGVILLRRASSSAPCAATPGDIAAAESAIRATVEGL